MTACSIINFNNPTLDRIQMKEACSLLQTAYHSRLGMHHYNAVEYLINKALMVGYNIFMVTTCIGNLSNNCIIPNECIL